jgi:hypothetical protein
MITLSLALAGLCVAVTPSKVDRLAIVPIIIPSGSNVITMSSVFTDVLRATERRRGIRALSFEEMSAGETNATLGHVRDCGTDAGCLSERLSPFGAKLGIIVLVNLSAEPPIVSIRLLDREAKRIIATATGPVRAQTEEISSTIRDWTKKLLTQAGYAPVSRLEVHPTPADALVRLVGSSTIGENAFTNVFELPAGRYEVHAEREGYEPKTQAIELGDSDDRQISLELEEVRHTILASPWFWTAIGLAIVAGASTTTYVLTRKSSAVCVCSGLSDSMCRGC